MTTRVSPDTPDLSDSERDAQTRNRLLRSAVQIFDRKGYSAASVREIAEMAGVTKPALYYHFGSKEGLLVTILNEAAQEFERVIARAAGHAGTARQRLLNASEDVYGMFSQHVPVVRVAHTVFLGPRDVAPTFDLTVFERGWRLALQRIVDDGKAAGEFRAGAASADVAMAVMGIVETAAERQLHPDFEPISMDMLRRMLNLLLDGVLTERA